MIHALRHQTFGASSGLLVPGQGQLFDEPAGAEDEPLPEEPTITVEAHQRKTQRRARLPPDLPRVDVVHDLPDDQKVCPDHGCALDPMGEEVSERLRFIPATIEVERLVCRKYTCPQCEGRIVTASKPAEMIPTSIATPSLLSWVAVSK